MTAQPDLIDDAGSLADSGLVETPEAQARTAPSERRERPARPVRGPRRAVSDAAAPEAAPVRFESPAAIVAQLQDAPAASDTAEDKPRAPRPRKPRAKPAASESGPAEAAE